MSAAISPAQVFSTSCVLGLCAAPSFSTDTGSEQDVTISSATSSATICYTTDLSAPGATTAGTCSAGNTYSAPVHITTTTTFKALVTKSGFTNSATVTQVYTIGGGAPTYVNSGSNWTGGNAMTLSVTTGNHLVVWTIANDRTTGHTCSDNAAGGTNTYVPDVVDVTPATTNVIGNLFHVHSLKSTATITITCTGTGYAVAAVQYSGGTGDLDTTTAGTNPSTCVQIASSPCTPAAFTATTAATIHVDTLGCPTGVTATVSQVDSNFTTRQSCLTGASCFVGLIGTREVASSSSLSNGINNDRFGNGQVVVHAAYK